MSPVKDFNKDLHLLSKKQLEAEIEVVQEQLKAAEERLKELPELIKNSTKVRKDMHENRRSFDSDIDSSEEKNINDWTMELEKKPQEIAGHKVNLECRQVALRNKNE